MHLRLVWVNIIKEKLMSFAFVKLVPVTYRTEETNVVYLTTEKNSSALNNVINN